MKVLFATVEMSPLAKVGGLADVAGSLPRALVRAGHDMRVIMPRHGGIDAPRLGYGESPAIGFALAGGRTVPGTVWQGFQGGVPTYLVDIPELLDRRQIYGEPDDNQRWLAFCDAVLQWLAGTDWRPDVLHLNDWHTAFIASRLREQNGGPLAALPCVFTIHNLAIKGEFDEDFAKTAGLGAASLTSNLTGEGWITHCGMGQGILWSDAINTVSPTYAREILTPEYGSGLDPLLCTRQDDLFGILNGIDEEEFNPATDQRLAARYDAADFAGHAADKAALQRRLALAEDAATPLIGMVTRLFMQKGADLAVEAVEGLLVQRPLQLAVLGTGDPVYHDQLQALAARHPGKVSVSLAFDADLAQQIYGGTDLFLMPSRFEPCGLGQMIALRYGSVPVVRRTGGLADTVREWTGSQGTGNGFVFDEPTSAALSDALGRALDTFARPAEWQQLVRRGMAEDNSWRAAAGEYARLYERAVAIARSGSSPARSG